MHDGNIRIGPKQAPKPPKRASRKPAALTGVALFLIAGFAAFQGFGTLSNTEGQLSGPVTITITSSGVTPPSVTVEPGTTLIWKNSDTIPHIISSETFPTEDGKPFVSTAIFPGSNTHVLVPVSAKGGTHAYISETSQTVNGTIVISGAAGTTASSTSTASFASIPTVALSSASSIARSSTISAAVIQSSSRSSIAAAAFTSSFSSSSMPSVTAGIIPTNTHTVGTFAGSVSDDGSTVPAAVTNVDYYPVSAPETGPTTWIILTASVAGVLVLTRKMFRKVA